MYKFVAVPILFVTLFAGQIFAIIIHVPQDYPTIQQGIDAANSGDIVLVAPGTYPEEIIMKADVIIMGAGEGLSIIDGGGNAGDVVRAIGNDITNTAKLQGFTITGADNNGSMPGGAGIFCNGGAAPEICNNRIVGNDLGIALWNQSSAFVHNNVIVDNEYRGIAISSASDIINNTIHNCRIGIYDSGGWLPTIMNNLVTGNTMYGIGCVNSSVPTNFSYNDVWNNGQNYYNCSAGSGDISVDPLYVNVPAGDFHLQLNSPCIDAGNPLPQYNDPDGTRNDMGAYGGPGATAAFPLVILAIPPQNELNVICNTDVSAMFNIEMDPSTFTSLTFRPSGHQTGIHSGIMNYDTLAKMVTLDADVDFRCGEFVTAILTKGIQSLSGDSLAGYVWQFTAKADSGAGVFSIPSDYSAGSNPNSVIIGDFDSDGNLDLTVANVNSNNVSVLLGNGDGSFNIPTNYPVGNNPHCICTGDFDNDGDLDLATANGGSNNISILLGNGDGTFGSAANYSANNLPNGICSGDFNADGNLDLAVANATSNDISILLGNGDGSFNIPTNYPVGNNPHCICTGDFDNDGDLDLATANGNSNNISVLLGDGDGNFGTATHYSVGSSPYALCISDFNGDGNLDIAVANSGSNNVSRLLGNGDGAFGSVANYAVGNTPYSICASDFDGDGDIDLAVANAASNNVSVLIGNGNGSFNPATEFSTGNDPHSVAAGDFDNDNDIDLSTANYNSNTLSILLNENALLVSATNPMQNQLAVSKSTNVSAAFNMGINPSSINDSTFIVTGTQSGLHLGTINYDSGTLTATLDPFIDFIDGEVAIALLTKDIETVDGIYLKGFSWNFALEVTTPSDGTFDYAQNFSVSNEPRGMYAGDLDGDGDVDLAVTSSDYPNAGRISVLLNNGDGTFSTSTQYTLAAVDPISVYGADLDGDGDIDLAVAHNEPGTSHLTILKNNGNGIFSVFATYAPAILGQTVFGGDLDSDGDVDLVMTDGWGSGDNVRVMFNNGDGSFSGPYTYSAGTFARGVIAKDVDNDGDMDVIVANAGSDNVSILLNDGDGNFPNLANYPIGSSPYRIYGNDFNTDGYIDIAAANGNGDITVILNNGNGTFASPTGYPTGTSARSIVGGDFDGDGDIDLAVTNSNMDSIAVILNNGNGTFANLSTYQVGDSPWGIQAADFDLDGDLDIACANCYSNDVTVLYNIGVGIEEIQQSSIAPFLQIHPNPFSRLANISFGIGQRAEGSVLKIYDLTGRIVRIFAINLCDLDKSVVSVFWDGTDNSNRKVPNGVYFCQLKTSVLTLTKQIILIR